MSLRARQPAEDRLVQGDQSGSPDVGAPSRPRRARLSNRTIVECVVAVSTILALVLWGSGYAMFVASLTLVFVIAALGQNIVAGYSGQLSLGSSGFMAVGAYSVAVGAYNGYSFAVSLLAGIILGLIVGLVVGLPAVRFAHLYLAIGTLAFTLAFERVLLIWRPVTRGAMGLPYTGGIAIGGWSVRSGRELFAVVLAITILSLLLGYSLTASRFGRAWRAIKISPKGAMATGIPVMRYRLLAFVWSAGFLALAGALHAVVAGYVEPAAYGKFSSIWILVMIIIGGQASIRGSIYGAVYVTALPEILRYFGYHHYHLVVLGSTLLLVLYFAPDGFAGRWRRARAD